MKLKGKLNEVKNFISRNHKTSMLLYETLPWTVRVKRPSTEKFDVGTNNLYWDLLLASLDFNMLSKDFMSV